MTVVGTKLFLFGGHCYMGLRFLFWIEDYLEYPSDLSFFYIYLFYLSSLLVLTFLSYSRICYWFGDLYISLSDEEVEQINGLHNQHAFSINSEAERAVNHSSNESDRIYPVSSIPRFLVKLSNDYFQPAKKFAHDFLKSIGKKVDAANASGPQQQRKRDRAYLHAMPDEPSFEIDPNITFSDPPVRLTVNGTLITDALFGFNPNISRIVPEPSVVLGLAMGSIALGRVSRRRRSA